MGAIMHGRRPGTRIGFVGLGSMGGPLAGRLLHRNRLFGTNRTRSKAVALIDKGLVWRDTPREVAEAADVVFSMVADDAALTTAAPRGGAGVGAVAGCGGVGCSLVGDA